MVNGHASWLNDVRKELVNLELGDIWDDPNCSSPKTLSDQIKRDNSTQCAQIVEKKPADGESYFTAQPSANDEPCITTTATVSVQRQIIAVKFAVRAREDPPIQRECVPFDDLREFCIFSIDSCVGFSPSF